MRAKDRCGKEIVGSSSANLVQKKNSNASHNKNKKKNKAPQNQTKTKQTTMFKKKKGNCYICNSLNHFAGKYPDCRDKTVNVVVSETGGTSW